MNILPLSGYFQQALSYLTLIGIFVQDVEYIKVSGQEILTDVGTREIEAAIDPSNMKQLEILFGSGNVSQGDLLIYTENQLYITDIFGPGDMKRQSFLMYSDFPYRILSYQDWVQQLGVRVYLARRHVQQQVV